MKEIKSFEEFIKEGIVKKVSPNFNRAKNLVAQSKRKVESLNDFLKKAGVNDKNANDYVESCYDLIMYLVRAKMLLKGYNATGLGAHEAEISYMRILEFNENDVQFADQMRYFRNGMLYYGTRIDKEYAEKVIEYTRRIYKKLKSI